MTNTPLLHRLAFPAVALLLGVLLYVAVPTLTFAVVGSLLVVALVGLWLQRPPGPIPPGLRPHVPTDALILSTARLRLLESAVVHAHDAVVILEAQPRDGLGRAVLYANDAFCRMTGYDREEVVGRSLHFLRGPGSDCTTLQAIREALADGRPLCVELRNYRKDGREFWVDLSLVPVPDPGGGAAHWVMIQRDITERRKLEEQLRHAQKMEAVGQMAGGVAHDFNNLLTAVLCNLSQVRLPKDHPNATHLAAVEKAIGRAADLTRKLLGYARRNQLVSVSIHPRDAFQEAVSLLRHTLDPRIRIVVTVDENCVPVQADPTLLSQVLLNLCLNARDAMPDGGTLTLAASTELVTDTEAAAQPGEARTGRFVRLSVADTGTGMSDEVKAHLFEPFFTTKGVGKGTGLGLPMVQGIVKQHHGWVACTSSPGAGTRLDLFFPPAAPETPRRTVIRTPTPCPESDVLQLPPLAPSIEHSGPRECLTGTVLIVDDEPMIRDIGRAVLERAGFQVVTADDGEEAVALFARDHASIDLVILDVTMPRMSGRDAFRQMVAIDPGVRVLFSTGYSSEEIAELDGAAGLLGKPYRPHELLTAVQATLQGKPLPAG